MTYDVFGGTLNLAQLNSTLAPKVSGKFHQDHPPMGAPNAGGVA